MLNGAVLIEERVRIPADVFRLRQFRAWVHSDAFPERGRFSFLGGEIDVDMSPEELETHNKVKLAIGRDISLWVDRLDLGEVFADRALLVNEAADLGTEPDLMFVSWRSIRSGQVHRQPDGQRGLCSLEGARRPIPARSGTQPSRRVPLYTPGT